MTCRGLLLSELDKAGRNCALIFGLVREEHLGWRPREGMRTLAELANHLAQIPSVDLRILRGSPEEEIVEIEQRLKRDGAAGWIEVMREGAADLTRHMERLNLDEYENGSATAFYGRTQTNTQWMLELITHIYHHRAQLFMYLKLLDYPVNTRTLYDLG